ncbi:Lrp/AsnC family transcriptional regulator [Candidatus Woesearchaeota archaeon]|nr:Lrp/AsnC family transcriptional regulator [Candidatus Woesearchaeota archaeon]
MELDDRDLEILDIVRENGKLPHRKIAEMTGIPIGTVFNKLKRLEDEKYIYHYSARVNYHKVGWNTVAFLLVSLDTDKLRNLKIQGHEAAEMIAKECPFISHISTVAGQADIVLRYHVKDINHLNEQVSKLRELPFIQRSQTLVALHSVEKDQLISGLSPRNLKKKSKNYEKIKKD